MSITLTIKQVPQAIADGLRRRAAANHRSQQQELLLILERAVADASVHDSRITEPSPPAYAAKVSSGKRGRSSEKTAPGELTIGQLWQRARSIGLHISEESIPNAFELPEGEVIIERRSGGLFITARRGGWDEFFAKPALSAELDPAELRATGPDRPVDLNLSARKPAVRRGRK